MNNEGVFFRGQQRAYYDFTAPDAGKRLARDQMLHAAAVRMATAEACCKTEKKTCTCEVKPVTKAAAYDPSTAVFQL